MNNLKKVGIVAVAAAISCSKNLEAASAPARPPNIVFVLTDDQRWDTAGFSNPGNVWTPGLDKLRDRSMQFTHAYAAYALCSPSRAAVLTGQYGSRNGVNQLGGFLLNPQASIANQLRTNGYQTAVCGKWHLDTSPKEAGFDWSVIFHGNGAWFGRAVNANGVEVRPKELVDSYCAGESVKFLRDRDKNRPFFLWHCTQLPHMDNQHSWPASAASLSRYKQDDMPLPSTWKGDEANKPDWLSSVRNRTQAIKFGYDKDPGIIRRHIHEYRATVSDLDNALQPLWEELDAQGLWENTIVVFMSDNGWMLGEHGLTSKVLAYEPAARVPLLIAAPGLPGGRHCGRLVSNLDIAPTLLEFAGMPIPTDTQGRSLRPLLTNPEAPFRSGFVYEGIGGYGGVPPMSAWITDRTKFIMTWDAEAGGKAVFTECYDLLGDPEEKSNLPITTALEETHRDALSNFSNHLAEQKVVPQTKGKPSGVIKSAPDSH